MANPEVGGVNRTIEDGNAVVNSGTGANKQDPEPTSDTEQYVGADMTNQRSGSKKKACFQITSVSKRNAAEHDHDGNMDDPDSNDELDESRADEFSSSELVDSFNISKNSIHDVDPSSLEVDGGNNSAVSAMPASGSAEEQSNSSSSSVPSNTNQANGNGPHRFKVVKVATEPIRKGRWTCRDFPSEVAKSQTTPEGLRNHESSKETLVHSGNSSAASSVHYVHGQDNSENPLSQVDEIGKPAELGRKVSTTSLKDMRNHSDAGIEEYHKDDRLGLDQLKDGLLEHTESTEGDDGTSPASGAIDNKIEQAMDLVKSHLLFAVREEVEVLKEQIKILVEKNDLLQEENTSLKQRLQVGTVPPPQGNPAPQSTLSQPHQGMPSQDQSKYPNMPNQMGQNLGQNPMGQTLSDHAAYPQHQRPTQQTHSTPNPGGLADTKPQYTPQTSVESQGQYHSAHSQLHIQSGQAQQQQPPQQQHLSQGMQERTQYSQVAATAPQQQQQTSSQATPQQTQGQYHSSLAPGAAGNRPNTTH